MADIHVSHEGATTAPPAPAERMPQAMGAAEPSLGELFRQLADESSTLIKQEIALAKKEIGESASRAASDATWIAVWGAIALVGGLVLIAFLVLLIGDLLDNYWLSALIVGAAFVLVGGLAAMSYVKKLKSVRLAPETTIQTLKQDKTWAQAEVQSVKRDLTS
jgi:hypothetical protein